MKKKYLKTEVNDEQYSKIAEYCNANGLKIETDSEYYYLLQPNEKVIDDVIVDNSEEYNRKIQISNAKNEIEQLKRELQESDYQVRKCYEYSLVGKALPYNITEIHNQSEAKRNRINELNLIINSI